MSSIVFHRAVSDSTYYPSSPSSSSSSSSSSVTHGYASSVVMPISIGPYSASPSPQAISHLAGRVTIDIGNGPQVVVMPLPLDKKS